MSNPATARPLARLMPYWIGAALAWFGTLGLRPLFNPDEGRYAEIPREMLRSGNFVLPRLNDLVYLEKPPLQYWATAAMMRLFGVHPWSARLCSALAAALGVALVYAAARSLWGRHRAEIAALMSASMLFYVFMGELLTLDMLLTVLLLAALLSFCLAQDARASHPEASRRYLLLCWAAMAGATLTKGLIGVVIPGAVLVLYTLLSRDFAAWRHLLLGRGLALYALLVVPWFWLVERAHPGALWFLIVHEHFQRYLTTVHARYQPIWYFLPILAAGVLPWLPQVLRALATGWRASVPPGRFDAARLLWVAVVFIVGFFSISDSKLAPYILPALPLLALLAAKDGKSAAPDLRRSAWLAIAIGVGLGVALIAYPRLASLGRNLPLYTSAAPWLAGAAALAALGGSLALGAGEDWPSGVRRLALTWFAAALLLATGGAASLAWKYSGSVVLPELNAALRTAPADVPLYSVQTYDWTLPVYTGRMLIPVQWRGELDYGLNIEPGKGISDFGEFARRWREADQALAIIEPAQLHVMADAALPYTVLKASPELVLLGRR